MSGKNTTSAIVDNVLRIVVTGGVLAAGLAIPNLMVALDKPLEKFWKHLDKRERERAVRRAVSYMKSSRLLSGDYQHGLRITQKGQARLKKLELDDIRVEPSPRWDKRWRLVLYDIPESHKQGRNALTAKLNELGFYQLQRSAWLHPFACRNVIESVTAYYEINTYVSCVEILAIDNQRILIDKFQKRYPKTKF